MNIIDQNPAKLTNLLELLPHELNLVSYISLSMNHTKFIEYTTIMNPMKIVDSSIDNNQKIFVFLLLALMYENPDMCSFIHNILEKMGDNMVYSEFERAIKLINTEVLTPQKGGAKIFYNLALIGIVIFTAFYDYFIITSGTWGQMTNTFNQIKDISLIVQDGCGEYYPSNVAHFLATYGAKDDKLVYSVDAIMQCLVTPQVLSIKLEKIYMENEGGKLLQELQQELKQLPGIPELPGLQELSEPSNELVLFQQNNQIVPYFANMLKIEPNNVNEIKDQLKNLVKLSPDEFKKVIQGQVASSVMPSVMPSAMPSVMPSAMPSAVPTQTPVFSRATAFVSDLAGAIQEIAPTQLTPSLNIENILYYTLQDTIRKTLRKMEDTKTEVTREIEDLITKATRLVSEITSLPRTLFFLFSINTSSLFAIIYFTKKFMGTKSKSTPLYINYDENFENGLGGYRKRKTIHKQKRSNKKHKTYKQKRSNKKHKTRHIKRRRITKRH